MNQIQFQHYHLTILFKRIISDFRYDCQNNINKQNYGKLLLFKDNLRE